MKLIFYFLLFCLLISCKSNEKQVADEHINQSIEKASMAEIEQGIKSYIQDKVEEGQGFFHLKNDSFDLNVRLVRVHTEYLANLAPGSYFACVDLADENGDVYDVDFFLEGSSDNMNVVKKSIHKLNGKPFYTWKQNKEDKTWFKIPLEQAGNKLLGVVEEKDQFEFFYDVTLPEIRGKGQIWIPIAQSNNFQDITINNITTPTKEQFLEDQFGNKILYLELDNTHSNKKINIAYSVERIEKKPYQASESENLDKYLTENMLIPVGEDFREKAFIILDDKRNDNTLVQARALYDYIIDSVSYIKDGYYGRGDAVYACDAKSGNCSEFHSYFIALARSINIPARFAIGAAIPSSRDEGGIDGYHCWAEFYADGKWWPVDISEANKYSALATYYFGHHGANRVELSKGRDLSVSPGPSYGDINFLAFPVMEINQENIRPKTVFSFKRK